ncbi:MAG: type II toxin-antitoxin system HicB family antitoxin [Candidatus Parabeggiatoa sp.]|nr:type II toxin-antitoxin system HicB family antitoxin [Candidatus Parabeggiatoa sp.]HIE01072.1 type II toxin-antitoxin system HicB family antitoxin [Thiotrichaceae bacterium]
MKKTGSKHHTFTILIEQDDDGYYVATVPALKSCYTQAKTLEALYPRIKEVIELCLEEEEFLPMKFIGVQRLEFEGCEINL